MQLKERTISVCKTVSISVPRHSVCYSRQHYNMVKFTMNCSRHSLSLSLSPHPLPCCSLWVKICICQKTFGIQWGALHLVTSWRNKLWITIGDCNNFRVYFTRQSSWPFGRANNVSLSWLREPLGQYWATLVCWPAGQSIKSALRWAAELRQLCKLSATR